MAQDAQNVGHFGEVIHPFLLHEYSKIRVEALASPTVFSHDWLIHCDNYFGTVRPLLLDALLKRDMEHVKPLPVLLYLIF